MVEGRHGTVGNPAEGQRIVRGDQKTGDHEENGHAVIAVDHRRADPTGRDQQRQRAVHEVVGEREMQQEHRKDGHAAQKINPRAPLRAWRQPVPPTVSASMRSVGWPTPTGIDCPSLPQVPTPLSSFRSLPTMLTRVSTSGPLPISVPPLTGAPTLPFSIK